MTAIILSVPHIPQRDQGECLPACAAMMLRYMGRPVNYNQLLKLLQVRTSIGAPSSNIHNCSFSDVQLACRVSKAEILPEDLLEFKNWKSLNRARNFTSPQNRL